MSLAITTTFPFVFAHHTMAQSTIFAMLLEVAAGDFAFAADHRRRALPQAHRFQISLRSRCTAMLAGFRTLIQTRHGPDRYIPSTFFDTMPSAPSRHAWASTVGPSSAICSLSGMQSRIAEETRQSWLTFEKWMVPQILSIALNQI
jgi:hypothetical protein